MTDATPAPNPLLNNSITANFGNAAGGDAHFNKDIVNYRDPNLDPALKKRMDDLIATIDINDLNTITVFAKEPTETLRQSSEAIVKRAQNATGFLGGFANIKQKLANFDFEGVGKMAAEYSQKVARRIEMASLTWLKNPIKKLYYALTGSKHNVSIDNIRTEIDKSLLQLADVVSDLEDSKAKIPQVITDLKTLEKGRLDAYSEYSVYLGAALEKFRRVKEVDIPKLVKEVDDSPVKQAELSNLTIAETVLNTKLTDMDTFHKSSLVQLKTIDDMKQALAMSQLKIDSHLTISQGQWEAILAESAVTAQISQIAETVQAADQFGDKIFEQSGKLSDMTKEMARAAFGHGTLDPVKVVGALQKRTQDIADDLTFLTDFNAKMESQRAALDEAGQKFREAASKVTTAFTAPANNNTAAPAAQKPAA